MFRILCLILLSAGAAAAGDGSQQDVTITLERTACYGSCPVYKLTIKGDGSVTYAGSKNVRVTGHQHSRIDSADLQLLLQAFINVNYFSLENSYRTIKNPDGSETVVTDLPTTFTSLTLKGRHKQVEDYVGAPKELEALEHKIDTVAGSKRWVRIDAPTLHEEVRHGWNVNDFEARVLFENAVRRGDTDVVRAFIEEGVDVNAKIGDIRPLQVARGGEVVKLLIAAGADVNVRSKEYFGPPLVEISETGNVESIKALIDAGAKVNGISPDRQTALMKAASSGSPEAVKALLMAGAGVNLRDSSGETALDYARHWFERQRGLEKNPDHFEELTPEYQQKYKEIQDLLVSAGGESKH